MENNYQLSRIHNYIHGLMSREEMHALEREALDDPFLQDAIDGYRLQNGVDTKSLSLLQQRLEKQVLEHAQRKNRYFFSWQRLTIGLVAAVLFISVSTLLLIRHLPNRGAHKVTEVELMDETFTKMRVRPLSATDAVPVGGWDAFASFFATHYSGSDVDNKLEMRFKVDRAGLPYDVEISGISEEDKIAEITRLLKSGPKWKGLHGHIEILFPE